MDIKENLPTPLVIKDTAALSSLVDRLRGPALSISPPLQVGAEFVLAVCQGAQLSDCTCIHVPLAHVRKVADVLFADRAKRVYVHALKEVMVWFKRHGIDLYAEMFLDVSLAAYLLNPPEPDRGEDWRKYLLSSLVREYLKGPYPFAYPRVAGKDYPEALYGQLLQDALYVWRLGPILVGEILKDETLLQPYWELEIMLTPVLAEMELRGVGLDQIKVARAELKVRRALDVLFQGLEELHGLPFSPWSTDDAREFLNRTCELRLGKTDPIDDDLLKGLARSYPAAFKLRTWRRLLQTLRFLERSLGKDRRYPRWWLTRTVVGRIVCTDPPLQSLPKYTRKYLSPGEGKVFIKADFSAFQLRLLAHLSQDKTLVDLFLSGRNPHDETQARLSARGVPITRAQAKTLNFSICYGGTAWSLKDNLGLGFHGLKVAQQIMREMKEIYPDLFAYLEGVKEALDSSPEGERYVRSIRGRRRAFSYHGDLTGRERRQAANAVVQMLEADVFKKTVLDLDKAFKRESLPVEMVMLLHDGIWFTCPAGHMQHAKRVIKDVMEHSVQLSVPLVVDLSD
jgi:DNA polymerase I